MDLDPALPADGRRARRDRNRRAVIDAALSLLAEGTGPPSPEAVAARSGVSQSSIFRYFDGLDDLQQQAIATVLARAAPLFEVPVTDGSWDERVGALVDARLALYRSIAPAARLARVRALEHPRVAASLTATRAQLLRQLRAQLKPELAALPRGRAAEVVAIVEVLLSFESWDLMSARLPAGRLRAVWVAGASAVVPR